jgi:hypothetical protein
MATLTFRVPIESSGNDLERVMRFELTTLTLAR